MYACDMDGSETLDRWEFFECELAAENAWRMEHCEDPYLLYCYNPYTHCDCPL